MDQKNKISFLINSFLLQYPSNEWRETLQEVLKEAERIKHEAYGRQIIKFLNYVEEVDAFDLEELYVSTFDFAKNTNLYLTYYEYRDDRKRGEALIGIKKRYKEAGINLINKELPDFLPVVLEYTAISGEEDLLANYSVVLKKVFENLLKAKNPYTCVLEAILLTLEQPCSIGYETAEVLGGAAK